jgi:hypothetical protein
MKTWWRLPGDATDDRAGPPVPHSGAIVEAAPETASRPTESTVAPAAPLRQRPEDVAQLLPVLPDDAPESLRRFLRRRSTQDVLARYPEYDRPDWPEDELRRFVANALAAEERNNQRGREQ